jgi:hypothetical protein
MARLDDWPERLLAEVARHSDLPLQWGVSDCFTFPMDCVIAMTGKDPWPGERKYKSASGAARRLARHHFRNVGDAFAARFEEVAPSFALRGDLGVIETPQGVAGVVFVDSDVLGKDEVRGLRRVPRAAVTRAFRV